jgi:branched-chain amino acid transport system permease protein
LFFQQLVNGITIGSTYSLVTIGFTMVYGVLELTNFAHSSFYMLGAYLTLLSMATIGFTPRMFLLSVLVSVVVCGVASAVMDAISLRPIRDRKGAGISALLCTVGIQTFINNTILATIGSETKSLPDVFKFGKFMIGDVVISWMQIFIVSLAIVIMLGLSVMINHTRFGSAMRAIAQNTMAARAMGIEVNRVITWTFFISAVISAIAGAMVGMYYQAVDITMANSVGSKAFAAAVLGGIGVMPGAVLGGFAIGIVETLVAGFISSGYRDAIAFAILIVVLAVRPHGILGQKPLTKV